jgi:hypothetical protein
MKHSQLYAQSLHNASARAIYRNNTKRFRIIISSMLVLASFVCLGIYLYFVKRLPFTAVVGNLSRLLLLLLVPFLIISLLLLAILFLYRKLKRK